MDNVTELNPNRLRTREEICEDLGISQRTLYRRIKDFEVETVETPDGVRYFSVHTLPPVATKDGKDGKSSDSFATFGKTMAKAFEDDREELKQANARIVELTSSVARLDERTKQLQSAKLQIEDLQRDVDKWRTRAESAEKQSADFAARLDERTKLLEERTDELKQLRSRLPEAERDAIAWRARYHVARGRVEMDDD